MWITSGSSRLATATTATVAIAIASPSAKRWRRAGVWVIKNAAIRMPR